MSASVLRRALHRLFLALAIAAFFLLCAFKILDRDFWWHITAGNLMWETGQLIAVEPFAYTRDGMPYLATHEWLAQIILYGIHQFGGSTGIILFRSVMMTVTFLLLLGIDWQQVWPNALLAVVGAAAVAGGFLERPQLFTFVIVAALLLLATQYLQRRHRRVELSLTQKDGMILAGMVFLQILWVNLHGAAAMVGLMIIGSLLPQRAWTAWNANGTLLLMRNRELWTLAVTCIAFTLALLASPSGLGNIEYLRTLLTDKTIGFISEWRPREQGYAAFIGPFWILWITTLLLVRRDWVFCLLVAGITGYLSLQAVRHETLFVFCALAVTFHQLKHSPWWHNALDRLLARPLLAVGASVLLALPVAAFAHSAYRQVVERDHLWGYGVFAPAAGAADFVEREDIRGNMFNTYGIGGYLMHRFYTDPTRKVFIDGRNVDYGYDFMNAAFVAGHSEAEWKVIEDRYDITYALIDYDAIKQPGWLSYSRVLNADSRWSLVYIDDWTAVYVKDVAQNRGVIDKHRFILLTAEGLEFKTVLAMPKEQWPALEEELHRAIVESPKSVKARNILTSLLIRQNRLEEAENLAKDIEPLQPYRPESWALRGAIDTTRKNYHGAAQHFRQMLALADDDYPDINYAVIADVFAKAGDERSARRYRLRAEQTTDIQTMDEPSTSDLATSPLSDESSPPAKISPPDPQEPPAETQDDSDSLSNLFSGMQEDIEYANNAGIDLAQEGKYSEARESFLRALMLDPGNPLTLSNLCAVSLQEGKTDEAIDFCERGRSRGEEFADLHYNLALAYLRAGKLDKARWHAERAELAGRDAGDMLRLLGTSGGTSGRGEPL